MNAEVKAWHNRRIAEKLKPIIDNLTQAAATAELAETMTGEEVARMLREVAEQLRK